MAKLHEVLAAEKTTVAAWHELFEDTVRKMKNPSDFFVGHSKSLAMIEDTPVNKALEAQAAEEKKVTTSVAETLAYAFDIFGRSEKLQMQKNATNRTATATVMFDGEPLLPDMPVDELLGLEARLKKIRELFELMPTMAGSVRWERAPSFGPFVWQSTTPSINTKTDKVMTPVVMSPATDKHPAQVQAVTKDLVVGTVTSIHRTGCCTTDQKARALTMIDSLMMEVKQARMRANATEVVEVGAAANALVALLMSPFVKD